jgi:hypothetical protein
MLAVVRVKAYVVLDGLRPSGFRIVAAIDGATQALGWDLTISGGLEDPPAPLTPRAPDDPHKLGEALDVSSRGLSDERIVITYRWIQRKLGPLFTVLYEVLTAPANPQLAAIAYLSQNLTAPHFHIQRKKGTIYPPA